MAVIKTRKIKVIVPMQAFLRSTGLLNKLNEYLVAISTVEIKEASFIVFYFYEFFMLFISF